MRKRKEEATTTTTVLKINCTENPMCPEIRRAQNTDENTLH